MHCILRSLWSTNNQINHKGFQQYGLFERRTKLFYMNFLLVDAEWRHTMQLPGVQLYLGVLRGASYPQLDYIMFEITLIFDKWLPRQWNLVI